MRLALALVVLLAAALPALGIRFHSVEPADPYAHWVTDRQGNRYGGPNGLTKVDPSGRIVYSLQYGMSGAVRALAIAIDAEGNAWAGGIGSAPGLTLGIALSTASSSAFLMKVSPSGQLLAASKFGAGDTTIQAIAIDGAGFAYLTGTTSSPKFPIRPGPGPLFGQVDDRRVQYGAFVTKVTPGCDRIVYSTYLSASTLACEPASGSTCTMYRTRFTRGTAIAVDSRGRAWVAAHSTGWDLPTTPDAVRTAGIGPYLFQLGENGTSLLYASYFGKSLWGTGSAQSEADSIQRMETDPAGNLYLAGYTSNSEFPVTANAAQTSFCGPHLGSTPSTPSPDLFVTKISPEGRLLYSTFLGGSSSETLEDLLVDSLGYIHLSGTTSSTDFPDSVGLFPSGTQFVAGIDPATGRLLYSARLAGQGGRLLTRGSDLVLSGMRTAIGYDWTAAPAPALFGISSAAANRYSETVAPGEMVWIYGDFPASSSLSANIAGQPVEILSSSRSRLLAVLPRGIAPSDTAALELLDRGLPLAAVPVTVAESAPAVFYPVRNDDGNVNSQTRPAIVNSGVSFWVTGLPQDGPACEIRNLGARIVYQGPAPGPGPSVRQFNLHFDGPMDIFGTSPHSLMLVCGKVLFSAIVWFNSQVTRLGTLQ